MTLFDSRQVFFNSTDPKNAILIDDDVVAVFDLPTVEAVLGGKRVVPIRPAGGRE